MTYTIQKKYLEKYYKVNGIQYWGYSNLILSTEGKEIATMVYKQKDAFIAINNESWTIAKKKWFFFNKIIEIKEDVSSNIIGVCNTAYRSILDQSFQIEIVLEKKKYVFYQKNVSNRIFDFNPKNHKKYAFNLKNGSEYALFEFEVTYPDTYFIGSAIDKPFIGKIDTNVSDIKIILVGLYFIEFYFHEYTEY